MSRLDDLVNKSVYILREAKSRFKNPCVMWSTGKDSTIALHLCREAFFGEVPFPVVFIDTGWHFKEVYKFRDRLADEWNLNLIVAKSHDAGWIRPNVSRGYFVSHQECCSRLKTEPLREVIEKNGFDAVIVSIRRDEHYMRSYERVMSPRDKDFRWRFVEIKDSEDLPLSLQEPEIWSLYQTEFEDSHHVRVHPLLHWTELDVWEYIKKENIPYNPLYHKGYRSIGCRLCCKPVTKETETLDEIIEILKKEKGTERAGRMQNKEFLMRRLRALGYF